MSFDIRRGETVALLGPNGAGKSTAIDTMLGLRAPTSGEVRVLGGVPAAAVAAGQIGGMLQTGGLAKERQNGWMRQLRVSPISAPRWFVAKLAQGSVGMSERRLSVASQVVQDDPAPKHEIGKRAPPGAVIVAQSVDEDQRIAAAGFKPGDVEVVTARPHVLAKPCG